MAVSSHVETVHTSQSMFLRATRQSKTDQRQNRLSYNHLMKTVGDNKNHKTGSVRIGNTSVLIHGKRPSRLADPYHFVLKLSWPKFYAVLIAAFAAINVLFGTLYWLLPGSVANVSPGSYIDYVVFSIETLTTVGYGAMSPATTAGHVLASIEILVGMIGIAVTTGVIFARFAKPTARCMFSNHALIRVFEG